jgi:hypothetical protein
VVLVASEVAVLASELCSVFLHAKVRLSPVHSTKLPFVVGPSYALEEVESVRLRPFQQTLPLKDMSCYWGVDDDRLLSEFDDHPLSVDDGSSPQKESPSAYLESSSGRTANNKGSRRSKGRCQIEGGAARGRR